ncbi:hypothetical protein [Geosporobacter ferrireducens]|uniref:Uncharacterized protein n=1 Tax=Geosporobacter ferrireducens TaxID=1424294 RepID=A0A1D8GN37_9FIRM|nr:hypothetical protein [Geosporobacter ferrireducens]AOT72328.1 hypothetical protein Gferi_23940 [Geosporobacter ferrireducens]
MKEQFICYELPMYLGFIKPSDSSLYNQVGEIMNCCLCGEETDNCNPWGDYICNECMENIYLENNRISNLNDKDRCIELKSSINNLIKIIETENKGPFPRFYSYLKIMSKNLDICIKENFEDLDELIPLLKEDWANCWQIHCGLDDWYIQREEHEEQVKINMLFRKMEHKIEKLMKFKDSV